MAKLRAEAAARKISMIGDIPIFVAHQSADVWSHQDFFCLNKSGQPSVVAGCPPDRFNADGQLWGNALYDWPAMKKNKYDWWARRFERLLDQFDVIRLDHFIGFYRYWAIPAKAKNARTGQWRYTPGEDFFNTIIARLKKLPLIAEDLGLVTKEVVELREKFSFPGMRIVQFAFSNGDDADHHKPHNYDRNSVVYTGTHDNETALGYMQRLKSEKRKTDGAHSGEFNTACAYLGLMPKNYMLAPAAMVRTAFASISNLAIMPMQDLLNLPANHRMNIPGTANGNWKWRALANEFNGELASKMHRQAELFGRLPCSK